MAEEKAKSKGPGPGWLIASGLVSTALIAVGLWPLAILTGIPILIILWLVFLTMVGQLAAVIRGDGQRRG